MARSSARWISGLLLALFVLAEPAFAQDKLRVSIWGGRWRDAMHEMVSKKFTEQTGVPVDYVTGGNADRLAKAKMAGANGESDVTFTTSQWGYLYDSGGLFDPLDLKLIPNAADLFSNAKLGKNYIGIWSFVNAIGYRPDKIPADMTIASWKDLWNPRLKGLVGLHGTDPSSLIIATTKLAGADITNWQKAQPLLKDLKKNVKAFFSSDATSYELLANGEAPVQIMFAANAHTIAQKMKLNFVIPKEGGVAGFDVIAVTKGTKMRALAHQYINILLDPDVQARIANTMMVGPMNSKAKLDPDVAKLPGVFVTQKQWDEQAIVIDDKTRAEKLSEWREWMQENMLN